MRYVPVYKCPLCDKITIPSNITPVELDYNQLPELMGKIVQRSQWSGSLASMKFPMEVICKCYDGNAGLARFAGLVKYGHELKKF